MYLPIIEGIIGIPILCVMLYKGLNCFNQRILKSPKVTLIHPMLTSGQVTKPCRTTERDFRAAGNEAILLQVIPVINLISGEENEKFMKATEKKNDKILVGTLDISTPHD